MKSNILGGIVLIGSVAVMPAPAFAVRMVSGEMSTVARSGQRVTPSRLQSVGRQFRFSRLVEALRDLLQPD